MDSVARSPSVYYDINVDHIGDGCNIIRDAKALWPNGIIVFQDKNTKHVRCYLNKCSHQGGGFMVDMEDINSLTCMRHGWKLSGATGKYAHSEFYQQDLLHSELKGAVLRICS